MIPLDRSDLHNHSIYSDGLATAQDLCASAIRQRLWAFSLTDHDTWEGCPETGRIAEEKGLVFVPGCEISSGLNGNVHLLCYGPGVYGGAVTDWARRIRDSRPGRAMKIAEKLRENGLILNEENLERLRVPGVGRAHIARAMVRQGLCKSTGECFAKYLRNGACAYVPLEMASASDTVAALRDECRVVLAHPMRLGLRMNEVFSLVLSLKTLGLWGVECYHPSAAHSQSRLLAAFCEREGLRVTGGSDNHEAGRKSMTGEFYRRGEGMRSVIEEMLE